MCLILLAYRQHPDYPLILAANRDEFYQRPSRAADFWEDAPILAGRDLQQGGTWLGLSRRGRIAAVTNYRDPAAPSGPRSRGELPTRCLTAESVPAAIAELKQEADQYSGFNLLAGGLDGLYYLSNRDPAGIEPQCLTPGVHGLSNHLLNSPWPKLERARLQMQQLLDSPQLAPEPFFDLLKDSTPAPDDQLPDTGVGLAMERFLSSIFIAGPHYGTRASTVILISRQGEATFVEQSYGPNGRPGGLRRFQLSLGSQLGLAPDR